MKVRSRAVARPARAWAPAKNASGFGWNPVGAEGRCVFSGSGFTLIELVISAAIGSIILISAYACLRAGLIGQKLVDARTDAIQSARVALDLMVADLRGATPLSSDFEFLGGQRTLDGKDASNVDFATHNYSPRAEREADICEVSYFLEKDPETETLSLWRRVDPSPDLEPLTGGGREEIARHVVGFALEYYDGYEWFSTWGDAEGKYKGADTSLLDSNTHGMPEAVRITIDLDSDPATLTGEKNRTDPEIKRSTLAFQTVVRLELATISYTSGSSSSPGGEREQGGAQ